jgi:quercetin dioxygenase-like cupin family protein
VGFELAYTIKGKSIFRQGDKEYELKVGDLVYHNALVPHSVAALESHEFLGIHFI